MVQRSRQTLKKSFSKGKRPSEQDFENLIDSSLNILDDGFYKTPEAGIQLAPSAGEKRVVLSVFREPEDPHPVWELSVGESGDLKISRYQAENSQPFLTLSPEGSIEIGGDEHDVILKGNVQISTRQGAFASGKVPANGEWHDITSPLEGVWALEIVAVSGKARPLRSAILIAQATHSFGSHTRIKTVQSYQGIYGNKLFLRWKKYGHTATLQIKSLLGYGRHTYIRYQISSLWNDPMLEE